MQYKKFYMRAFIIEHIYIYMCAVVSIHSCQNMQKYNNDQWRIIVIKSDIRA